MAADHPDEVAVGVDAADANSAKFREAMGDANMKHYRELAAASIESSQTQSVRLRSGDELRSG